MAVPYKKQHSTYGELINPITKDNPYLHSTTIKPEVSVRMWEITRNRFFTGKTVVTISKIILKFC